MTQYTVQHLMSRLEGKIHDQSLNKLPGSIYDKIDEAAQNILLKFDPKETKQYIVLSEVTPGSKIYTAPSNLKGNSIITLKKSYDAGVTYNPYMTGLSSEEEVSYNSTEYEIAVDYNSGTKTIYFKNNDIIDPNIKYKMGYYSDQIFKDSVSLELKDYPTSAEDIILLEKDTVNVLFYELCELVAQELQGEDSSFDLKYWQNKKKVIWEEYRLRYPSESKKKQNKYYKPFKR